MSGKAFLILLAALAASPAAAGQPASLATLLVEDSTLADNSLARLLTVYPPGSDFDVEAITAPSDSVLLNYHIIATALVHACEANQGESTLVRMQVGDSFDDTAVAVIGPGKTVTVKFADWHADSLGEFAVRCSLLAPDYDSTNDVRSKTATVYSPGTDFAVLSIASPPDTVLVDSTFTPAALIQAGVPNLAETTLVRMTIGATYDDTAVAVIPAGQTQEVSFASWQAQQTGTFTARCSLLTPDIDSTNDAGTKQVRVREPGGGPGGPPEVEWTRTFEGWGCATGYCVQQTSDGGYVAVGHTNSPDSATSDAALLVKLDASGDTEWVRTFKGVGGMRGASVIQTSDGGFVVAGTAAADEWAGHWDPYLVRTDTSGIELWQSRLANDASASAWTVVGVGDTAYSVVARESWGDSAVMLYGIDGGGNIRWGRAYNVSYGFAQDDEKLSLCRTADGGFIVGTKTLLKVDSLGAQPQLKISGSLGNANSAVQTLDGGYAATGVTSDWASIYLLKTNANLDCVWTRTYLPSEWSRGQWVEQTTDGGYIICGTTRPGNGSDKVTLIRTLSDGTQEWVDTLFDGYGYSVRQTADGGYVVCGLYSDSSAGPDGTSYLFVSKLTSEAWRQ